MATFKAVPSEHQRQDGKRNIRLRVTHNRKVAYISTNIYANADELTGSTHKIKQNSNIASKCEQVIRKCYDYTNGLGFAVNNMSIEDLVERLKSELVGGAAFRLDFFVFAREQIATMKQGNARNYSVMLNSVGRYINRDTLDINDITHDFIQGYIKYLLTEPTQRGAIRKKNDNDTASKSKGGRAVTLYLSYVRAIHNLAKKTYNRENLGIIKIPYSPFAEIKLQQPRAKKRAISTDVIQHIIDLPNARTIELKVTKFRRQDMARDVFLLSFALAGMNSVDIFTCAPASSGVLIYNRTKTADRRDDDAEMHIKIPKCVASIVEKYKDVTGQRMFSFYQHYRDKDLFNDAINTGLDDVAKAIGLDDLTYYAARHSWATIARSAAVAIDKETVHEALNHVSQDMKITDIYIDKDWALIWNANEKVLAQFDWSNIQ